MKKLDPTSLRLMIASAANNLKNNADGINGINVFPIPDGDTGDNMSRTFCVAADAVAALDERAGVSEIIDTLSSNAMKYSSGVSGVILSRIIRGMRTLGTGENTDGVEAVSRALCGARDAVCTEKTPSGTICAVVRDIADYAESNFLKHDDILSFLELALSVGYESLERTRESLPELKDAGVVDAGGLGLMTLFDGAVYALMTGRAVRPVNLSTDTVETANTGISRTVVKYRYSTEFLIRKKSDRSAAQLIAAIKPKGERMLVIDDANVVRVHIHTDRPDFVIGEALKLGELTDIKIENLTYCDENNK